MTIAKKLGALTLAFAAVSTSGCASDTDYMFMVELYTFGTLGTILRGGSQNVSTDLNCDSDTPAISLPECKKQNKKTPAKPDAVAPQPKAH